MPTTLPTRTPLQLELEELAARIRRERDLAEALRNSRRMTLRRIVLTRVALWWCGVEMRRAERRRHSD